MSGLVSEMATGEAWKEGTRARSKGLVNVTHQPCSGVLDMRATSRMGAAELGGTLACLAMDIHGRRGTVYSIVYMGRVDG